MQSDIRPLLTSLQKELTELSPGVIPLTHYEKALSIITAYLQQLRQAVRNLDNTDLGSVIALNKYAIPTIYAEFIYYATLYNLESAKPFGNKQRDFYREEFERIEAWFVSHDEFLRYYRSNKTHLDETFFITSSVKAGNYIDLYFPLIEDPFCTQYSFLAAMGMAYQRVQTELNRLIAEITPDIRPVTSIYWAHSKTDLTELIYALYASGAFNKGKATIKEITGFFEEVLQIGLGNTSVTFQEILRRKETTVFLDRLNDSFDRYINQVEQKNIR
jgi:hypothetical protein